MAPVTRNQRTNMSSSNPRRGTIAQLQPRAQPTGGAGAGDGGGAGGGDGVPPEVPAVPPTQAAIPFAYAPALLNRDILDFREGQAIKLYSNLSKPLYKEPTDFFDCSPERLMGFVTEVEQRVGEIGCENEMFWITDNTDPNNPIARNFLTYYSAISLEDVVAHASTYINQHSRVAQDNNILFEALWKSLTQSAKDKVVIWQDDYTINGRKSAAVVLKIITRESEVDTQATAPFIRSQLADLAPAMESVGSDIEKFNQHVRTLLRGLRRRRQRTDEYDLIANLFKGYKAASDETFVEYIARKEEEYEEGTEMTSDKLMSLALDKYAHRVRGDKWKKPSEQTAKLLAMEAKLERIQKENKKLRADRRTRSAGRSSGERNNNNQVSDNANKSPKGRDRPEWMFQEPPKEEKGKPKKVGAKTYHWCDAVKVWGTHTAGECRAGKDKHNGGKSDTDKRKIRFSRALQAVAEDEDQSTGSNE